LNLQHVVIVARFTCKFNPSSKITEQANQPVN
jgi:hypothetical protein